MKIRSITCFVNSSSPKGMKGILKVGEVARQAMAAYTAAGYEVETTRLATIPFPLMYAGLGSKEIVSAVRGLEQLAAEQGFNYVAVGPALIDRPESYELVPEIIANTKNVFCSSEMATHRHGLSLAAVKACAEIIIRLAPLDENGFANLYFAALSNVGPGSPFFPAAYHTGKEPAFALALEAAGLAVSAFQQAESLNDGLIRLRQSVDTHGGKLAQIGEAIQESSGVIFNGIDFSLAPFPDKATSLGTAIELMGVPQVGQHGSLAAAAMLASTLDQADFPRVGFNGLLFPQLEDAVLAERGADGSLTVKDLLMYSAVCGTGLDTIPLPGDTSAEALVPLLLDLAALGLRLDKPLTARLMPIPGKKAGDFTTFDFDYFANSRVMALNASGLTLGLDSDGRVDIRARGSG